MINNIEWWASLLLSSFLFVEIVWVSYKVLIQKPRRDYERMIEEMKIEEVYTALAHEELKEMVNRMPNDISTYTRNKRNALDKMRSKLLDDFARGYLNDI